MRNLVCIWMKSFESNDNNKSTKIEQWMNELIGRKLITVWVEYLLYSIYVLKLSPVCNSLEFCDFCHSHPSILFLLGHGGFGYCWPRYSVRSICDNQNVTFVLLLAKSVVSSRMSSEKGNAKRSRPQKYANHSAFKKDLYGTTSQTKELDNLKVEGLCSRCTSVIHWKIKFLKYKKLSVPSKW